jgi:putative ABC transport system ATP-binding protein
MTPLVVEHVTKTYRQGDRTVVALDDVSLRVEQGQFVAIMGASGSGKSTLLHLMAGLTAPDRGRILIAGQDITAMGDYQLTLFRRRHVGLVFQSFNLIPTLNARQNIALPLMLAGQNGQQVQARVDSLLEQLGLAHRADHRPDVMSGGEQQRVAIGRALVAEPALILADEPTGNLDSANSHAVCELLRGLCDQAGRTIVMVTHEPEVAAFARQVLVMRDGRVIGRQTAEGLVPV